MSFDLHLKPACGGCGSPADLYGSNCKHMTLCVACGKKMAETRGKCYECGVPVTRLIREYNVRSSSISDKSYFIGRFLSGLPEFSKKKNAENKWSLIKEGLQGRQVTDTLREKYKNKPWLLEDETGQSQYHGQLEGAQSANYFLLMMQGKEFVAIPAGSWYNFNKVAQYKQLTLEEAEEKMKARKKNADGYGRWMMKAAINGSAAFGEVEQSDDKDTAGGGKKGRKNANDDDDNASDGGDEEDEDDRRNRLRPSKKGGDDDDDEGPRGGDHDLDDDDIEKGDDWEHEEIFTDDDEAVGNDPEEREDLAPEVPAPPEIKEDEDDDEANEEEGGLSKSGKELKKLLGKAGGLNDSDADEEDDEEDMDDDVSMSPVLAPKQKDLPKEEPADNSPTKVALTGSARGTPPTSKSAKAKRKSGGDDAKTANGAPAKKVKTENESKSSAKDGSSSLKSTTATIKGALPSSTKTGSITSAGPVTEDEIRAVLLQMAPVTTQDLVARFKARLKTKEDKAAFADVLRKISKIQKTSGHNYVVLRDK